MAFMSWQWPVAWQHNESGRRQAGQRRRLAWRRMAEAGMEIMMTSEMAGLRKRRR